MNGTDFNSITVRQFFNEGKGRLHLVSLTGECDEALEREIPEPLSHRSGLALTGFFENFAWKRIQVIGLAEYSYLKTLSADVRRQRIDALFSRSIPCLVFARGLEPFAEALSLGEEKHIAVFQTELETRYFIHLSAFVLENLMAPRCALHGTMLDVAGVGVFLEGDAGIGKSETALGLIKRGYALVADDFTIFKRDGSNRLIASSKKLTKNYMEIRGIGIIYIPWIFGVGTVKDEMKLDLVITFLRANASSDFDRTGMEKQYKDILGINVPRLTIPVALGRDLVNLVETAAQSHKLKLSGYVAAEDLDARLKRNNVSMRG